MIQRKILGIFVGIGLFSPLGASEGTLWENFENYPVNASPKNGWDVREGSPSGVYWIAEEENNHFLKAKDTGKSVQFFRKGGWNLKTYPLLTWKWRVHQFPEGGDERNPSKNDSAVALYVVFKKKILPVPYTIKYVWSQNAPVDSIIRRKKDYPILVIRSGPAKPGEWVKETRNVFEDYKKLFDKNPRDPVAIGFLTDSNDVGGVAEGDYDDIGVLPLSFLSETSPQDLKLSIENQKEIPSSVSEK